MNNNIYYLPRRLLNSLNGRLTGQKALTAPDFSLVTRLKAVWEVFCMCGKCFRFLGGVLDPRMCFGFWEVFLDSGKCFGLWEVFWILGSVLNSGKCFWIRRSVFGFWEVFWFLGSVFEFWEVF